MFNIFKREFNNLFDKLKSHGKLRQEHIEDFLLQLRDILLNSDVSLEVSEGFITKLREEITEQNLLKSVSPNDIMRKIVYEEMIKLLTPKTETEINISNKLPNNILMVGLQGAGKTTASAKIALKFHKEKRKTLLVSLDTYRPAAQEQLKILADSYNLDSLAIIPDEKPLSIAARAQQFAKIHAYQVVVYDTAGRIHIDQNMMLELVELEKLLNPAETILVIDAMAGRISHEIMKAFDQYVSLDSFLLSRVDGDAKVGVAFNIKYMAKQPIKLLSTGENINDLEVFNPKSIVSRILNMGDLEELFNKVQNLQSDNQLLESSSKSKLDKIQSGQFDFNDYLQEISNVNKLGGIAKLVSMLPHSGMFKKKTTENAPGLAHDKAMILSMTYKERANPQILNASRKKRIALGSGVSISKIEKLIKNFNKMSIVMKKMFKMSDKAK